MSGLVSIAGLDKATLTFALWERSTVAMWFALEGVKPPTTTVDKVRRIGEACFWDLDYVAGRVIKCDLSQDEVNPRLYDRDNGPGAFRTVVDSLRKTA